MAEKITLDLILNNRGALTSLEDLREAVKVANAELATLGKGAKNFDALSSFVAAGNTEILKQQKLLKGLTSEEIAGAYARIGGGISSTFAAASAALATFGVENDSVLKAAADAQNLLTIAISTRQIQEGILSAKQLANLVAERARLALTRLSTTETNKETVAEVANSAAIDKNTSAELKNTAATAAKTSATQKETVATAGQTGAQGILNSVTTAGTNIMKTFYAAVAANPFGAIITLIGTLVTAVIVLKNLLQDTEGAFKKFNEATDESAGQIKAESIQIEGLIGVVQDLNRTQKDRQSAYEELQKILPGIKDLTLEEALAQDKLTQAYQLQITVLKAKARLDAAQQIYSEAFSQILKVQRKDIDDYAFTWQALLGVLAGPAGMGAAIGMMRARFDDLTDATEALSQADQLINTETKAYNEALIAQNNFINENTDEKGKNTTATNAQVIANNRLRDAYNALNKFLQDQLKLYKELGKVVEVEDKIPDLVDKVNQAYRERLKIQNESNNEFERGLVLLGFEEKILSNDQKRQKAINDFKNGVEPVYDTLENLSDVFGTQIEKDYQGLFLTIGLSTENFTKYIESLRKNYLKLFEEGKISPEALGSVDAMVSNLTSLNLLVREGGVSLSQTFNKEDLNEYLEAQREVAIAQGKIGFEIDKTTGKVVKATVDRENYSKNLGIIADFESKIYQNTVDGLEDIRKASNKNFQETVIRARNEKRITAEQAQTLLAQTDTLAKSEIERGRLIDEIAKQRVESIRNQVNATQKELDRVRKYNFEFNRDQANALAKYGASITALIEKNTAAFLQATKTNVRAQLTERGKVLEAERLLLARNLDITKFTEEQKKRIYKSTYDYQKALREKQREEDVKSIQEFIRITQLALNAYQEFLQSSRDLAIERISIEERKLIEALDAARDQSLVNEKEYQQKRLQLTEEYAAQRAAAEKRFRIRQMRLDQAQAIANGALGITRAYAEGGVSGLITGTILAAATAAQVGIIQQQISLANSFKRGGMIKAQEGMIVNGPSHEYGGVMLQNGAYNLEGGEAVINRVSSRNYQGLLSQINQMGGGRPLVASFDDSRIVDAIAKQKMEPIRAYVVEQDITNKQNVSKRLQQLSRF